MASSDSSGLRGFARALRRAPAAANLAAEKALNAGAQVAVELGRTQILSELNLERAYVNKQLTIRKNAKTTDLVAKVGARKRRVLATRYGASQATVPARSPKARLKGDPYRRIPRGRKAAGSTRWTPQRGKPGTAWANAFFFRGRGSGALIMATRRSAERYPWRVIYGPSVDQAWRSVRDDVLPSAMRKAEATFVREFNRSI